MDEVIVTMHAWEQYCTRVESIGLDELLNLLKSQLTEVEHRKGDFIKLNGVWWIIVENTFVTCYGRSHLDLPKAIDWAVRMNDRIVLDDA